MENSVTADGYLQWRLLHANLQFLPMLVMETAFLIICCTTDFIPDEYIPGCVCACTCSMVLLTVVMVCQVAYSETNPRVTYGDIIGRFNLFAWMGSIFGLCGTFYCMDGLAVKMHAVSGSLVLPSIFLITAVAVIRAIGLTLS